MLPRKCVSGKGASLGASNHDWKIHFTKDRHKLDHLSVTLAYNAPPPSLFPLVLMWHFPFQLTQSLQVYLDICLAPFWALEAVANIASVINFFSFCFFFCSQPFFDPPSFPNNFLRPSSRSPNYRAWENDQSYVFVHV